MKSILLFLSLVCASFCLDVEVPPTVIDIQPVLPPTKLCHRKDPKLNQCIQNNMMIFRPYLKKGFPEVGLPACDPFHVPEVAFKDNVNTSVFRSDYKNILAHGLSNYTVKSVKIDLENGVSRIVMTFPKLSMEADYLLNGTVLSMDIQGSGKCNGTYENVTATVDIEFKDVTKLGITYLSLSSLDVDIEMEGGSVRMDGLFGEDKQMGDAMNFYLNSNWDAVQKEVKPIIEQVIASLLKKFIDKMTGTYPLDLYLPA